MRRLFVSVCLLIMLLVAPAAVPAQTPSSDQLGEFLFTTDSLIFAINSDGSDRRELFPSTGHGFDDDAAWSPDGLYIAFNSYVYEGTEDALFIGHPRDQSVRRLTAVDGMQLFEIPAWAPDGSRLAFLAAPAGVPINERAIYVINRDGSDLRILREPPGAGFALGMPTWSPDGTQIIFAEIDIERTGNERRATRIMIMDADGANARESFIIESDIGKMAWSPDGTRLAFLVDYATFRGADGWASLYIANLDGSDLHTIPANEPTSPPVWSPDGNFIAYTGYRSQENRGIFITNVAGTSERLIPDTYGTRQIDWTAGAVEAQITSVEVIDRNLSTIIDSDEYVLDNCGSPAQRTDSWRIEHRLTRNVSFGTDLGGGSETTTCTGTNHTATWSVGAEIGPIKELINISGGYSDSTEQTEETCMAIHNELTSTYRLDEQTTVIESREFSVELPPNEIVKYEISVYEVAVQGYVTVARTNGFYADEVQIPFVLRDRIRIDARPVPATCGD